GTTPSGTNSCGVDLQGLLGATPECDACANENCCVAAQGYAADPNLDTYEALAGCTVWGIAPRCTDECAGPFCTDVQDRLHMPVEQACAVCVTSHCCDELDACESDGGCRPCVPWAAFEAQSCCGDPLFAAWDECVDTQCASECAHPMWYECEGAGGFGTGGTGDHGGGGGGGAGGGSAGSGG
ncbi:MAG: hypothetical protein JRI55_19275, partial [Deltaproteobacteria bacterium]|nr:hypothetical protein [Deltaproteobacteria bacterium]